jgi:thiamine biosynthesis lipoprotein
MVFIWNCRHAGMRSEVIFFAALFIAGCGVEKEVLFSGTTMATSYHVKIVTGYFRSTSHIPDLIEKRLLEINNSMSTYIEDSEISHFNALVDTNATYNISDSFFYVMMQARYVHEITEGAWDGTVKPLIKLWGFEDQSLISRSIPEKKDIDALLSSVGFDQISISEKKYLQKQHANLTLDLASIAKGYAVDQLAGLMRTLKIDNFIVEIGGEVYASGLRKDGKKWKVGINQPETNAAFNDVYKTVTLQNKALATSGDYRNYFEINGKRYSHVLDPRTGYPVTNGVVSVTVISDQCTFADGLATGIMVMGHKKGLELVEQLKGVECMIIVKETDGTLADYYSEGFEF